MFPINDAKPALCALAIYLLAGHHPVVVQSMITEETNNVPSAVDQIIAMHKAGSEIVRVTTPNLAEARCLAEIKARLKQQYMDVPLVADVHHQGSDIAVEVAKYVDKIRINPGLFVFRKRIARTLDYSVSEVEEEQAAIEKELATRHQRLQRARPCHANRRQSRQSGRAPDRDVRRYARRHGAVGD